MPPWTFVGRSMELARLVEAAGSAPGRGLVFGGAAGIGKTRLLREGIRALDADRLAVWTATATEATAGLPLGSIAPALPPDQPPGGTPVVLLRWAVDALDRQAAGRPVVVAIDNAHLLDPLSAALVYYLARSERATVFGTVRAGAETPESVRALWHDDLVDRVELGPLTQEETADLLAQVLGGPVDSGSVDRLWQLSEGNALLLRELVLAARAGNEVVEQYGVLRWNGHLTLAPSLTEVVDARIGRLTTEVRTVLELVAFGEPIGLTLLARATDPAAVEIAEERQLIRVVRDGRRTTVRLAHPLYGEVVRRRCPVTRVHRLLATLADLVEETGAARRDDLLRVAVWRLDSDTACDPRQLLAACRSAFASYDMPLANRLGQAAAALGGGLAAAETLAATLICIGRPADAIGVLDAVREQVSSERDRVRWLTVRAIASYWGLAEAGTIEAFAAARMEIRDPGNLAWMLAEESAMRLHRGDHRTALTLARQVLDHPASPPHPRRLAHSTMAYLLAVRGQPLQTLRLIDEIESGAGAWRPRVPNIQVAVELSRGTAMVLAGDLAAAETMISTEFAGLVNAGSFRVGSGYLAVVRAQVARLRGALAEAARAAGQAAATLGDGVVYSGLAHAERAHAAALAGEVAVAEAAMAEADRTHHPIMGVLYPWLEHARCWTAASSGRVDDAEAIATALVERLRADGFTAHEMVALHDLVRLDRISDRAAGRLSDLAANAEGAYPPLAAWHARALVGHDGPALLSVAEGFAGLGMYLYAAEAAAAAVTLLRSARSPLTPRATQRLVELRSACPDARTPALAVRQPVLTAREGQIARLAAVGVASKEIAERLFLSPRTVDNHLMRVYSKLGVTGRTELAAALGILPFDQ